MSVVRLSWDAG